MMPTFGTLKVFSDFCLAEYFLLEFRIEHTLHRVLHIVENIVDDTV